MPAEACRRGYSPGARLPTDMNDFSSAERATILRASQTMALCLELAQMVSALAMVHDRLLIVQGEITANLAQWRQTGDDAAADLIEQHLAALELKLPIVGEVQS